MPAKNISIPEVYFPAIYFLTLLLDIKLQRINCLLVFQILLLFNVSLFFEGPSHMTVALFVCSERVPPLEWPQGLENCVADVFIAVTISTLKTI